MKKTLLWLAALLAVLILAGCPDGSEEEEENNSLSTAFRLRVTGNVDSESPLLQAALQTNLQRPPEATATDPVNNTFTFHPLGAANVTKPFSTTGNYYIVLQDYGQGQSGTQWIYVGNNTSSTGELYTFTEGTISYTIPWEEFKKR